MADFIGAEPEEILFTSGATESNNLALLGYAGRNKRAGDHVIISEVEHISLHNIGKQLEKSGLRVTKVPPDQFGRINPEKLRARITDDTILVSVCWASNEIGTRATHPGHRRDAARNRRRPARGRGRRRGPPAHRHERPCR